MSESPQTTREEASRCPKCEHPGVEVAKVAARGLGVTRGAMLHTFECRNTRCRWNGEICRVVQINPDGSIPLVVKRDKQYPKVPDRTDEVNRMVEEQLRQEVDHADGRTAEVRTS